MQLHTMYAKFRWYTEDKFYNFPSVHCVRASRPGREHPSVCPMQMILSRRTDYSFRCIRARRRPIGGRTVTRFRRNSAHLPPSRITFLDHVDLRTASEL